MSMPRYIATKPLRLTSGRIQLDPAQYLLRQHYLTIVGPGQYEITGQICLKTGERFGYSGDLTKSGAAKLESPPATPAKKAEK